MARKYKKRKSRNYKNKNRKNKKIQKGGNFGGGMALGMFLPQVLGTISNILKIKV